MRLGEFDWLGAGRLALSQKKEDLTIESLVRKLLEKVEILETHLVVYQDKVKEAMASD